MIRRLALLIGSLAAAGVLAVGLTAAGFGPARMVDADSLADGGPATVAGADTDASATASRVRTESVYVRPAATPRVIHITRRARTEPPAARARVTRARTTIRHDDREEDEERDERDERERDDD